MLKKFTWIVALLVALSFVFMGCGELDLSSDPDMPEDGVYLGAFDYANADNPTRQLGWKFGKGGNFDIEDLQNATAIVLKFGTAVSGGFNIIWQGDSDGSAADYTFGWKSSTLFSDTGNVLDTKTVITEDKKVMKIVLNRAMVDYDAFKGVDAENGVINLLFQHWSPELKTMGLSSAYLEFGAATPLLSDFDIDTGWLTQVAGNSVINVPITPLAGKSNGAITYIYEGIPSEGTFYPRTTTIPSAVGKYKVTFNVGASYKSKMVGGKEEKTPDDKFGVVRGLPVGTLELVASAVTPVAGDFNVGNLLQWTAVGFPVVAPSITPQVGKSGGDITIKYAGSETLPTAVGTYAVTFDIAAKGAFLAATGLAGGTLTVRARPAQTAGVDKFSVPITSATAASMGNATWEPTFDGGTNGLFLNGIAFEDNWDWEATNTISIALPSPAILPADFDLAFYTHIIFRVEFYKKVAGVLTFDAAGFYFRIRLMNHATEIEGSNMIKELDNLGAGGWGMGTGEALNLYSTTTPLKPLSIAINRKPQVNTEDEIFVKINELSFERR